MTTKNAEFDRTGRLLRRGMHLVLLSGFFLLLAAVLTAFIDNAFLASALLILLVVLLYQPLSKQLHQLSDRFNFAQSAALENLPDSFRQELAGPVNLERLTSTICKYVELGIPGAKPALFLLDETLDNYRCLNDSSFPPIDMRAPVVNLLQSVSAAVDLTDTGSWPQAWRQNQEDIHSLNAAVLVPLNGSQQLPGWIQLDIKPDRGAYTAAELAYLSALAERSANSLERANIVKALETQVSELRHVNQFSQFLAFTVSFDDLLELAYTNYRQLLGVDDLQVYWRDPVTDNVYVVLYMEGNERIPANEGASKQVNDARVLDVLETGQMLIARNEEDCFEAIAPLNAGADTLGAIHTYYREPSRRFSQRQQQLLTVFAERTAIAMDRLHAQQQVELRARQLEIINEITFSLASTLELDPLLDLILDNAIELLDTQAGTFMLKTDDTGELEFRVVRGPSSQDLLGKRLPIGAGLAGTAAQTGRPVLVNRVREDSRWFDQVDASTRFETESILTVPMLRQNTVLGVLQVINRRNGAPFNEEDQMLLTAFAGQAVVALENARLLAQTDRALQERVVELSMLQQLDRDLNTTLELERVLNLTLDWILRICRGSAGAIVLVKEDNRLQLQAMRGQDHRFDEKPVDSDLLRSSLIGQVVESGKIHNSGNVREEPAYLALNNSVNSQMILPIIHMQNLIGIIAIGSDNMNAFNQEAEETALRVTNHAASAIANAFLYAQVQEANLAKSEFVSMVSHELKTPMTSMRGYTDLMLSGMTGDISAQQRKFLETISANIGRMGKQIQDLTDISRIETGRLRMELAPVPFSSIISDTLHSVRGPCDSKNIELNLDLPADLPLVMADKERIVQVLTNLLSNACKYSPEDTAVLVTVKPEMIPQAEGRPPLPMVHCSVKDNGYGISKEDLKKMFTKFFRADDPNVRKAPGTGLGLSITKGIVEFHGGNIWIESELGKGTTFHFTIPQAQE